FGLAPLTTYYLRAGGINWDGVVNYSTFGSTKTLLGTTPPLNPVIAAVYRSSITASWGSVNSDTGYVVEASTASDFTGTRFSTITLSGTDTSATAGIAVPLASNTTYYLRVGSRWSDGTTSYALTTPISTSTLTDLLSAQTIYRVYMSSL